MGRLARRRHAGMQRGPAPILRALLVQRWDRWSAPG
jgi:hypothetical protein